MFPEFGIVELIGKDEKPVTKENKIGEIVGTGFHNYIFPLIRYRTGDLGIYTKKKCPCGRHYPLLKKIEGRLQEFVISKTKQLVPLTGVYSLVASCSSNVRECQLFQDKVGELVLNIVKTQNYSKADDEIIKKSFKKRFGNQFNLTFCYVNQIPRTKGGKYQFLIQKLPIKLNF
jgi:phenylacetate-CoA ligase